jgi:hypothetical protein
MRDLLEVQHNNPTGPTATAGSYSQFGQSEYVRLIRQGGPDTRVQRLSSSWDHDQGAYQVHGKYRVETPLASFPLDVTVKGTEGRGKEFLGRQWQILSGGTGIPANSVTFTEAGQALLAQARSSREFAQGWLGKLAQRDLDQAYLLTLDPATRKRQEKCAGRDRVAADPDCRAFRAGRSAFQAGDLVRADEKDFWALPKFRDPILEGVKAAFRPRSGPPIEINLLQAPVPAWTREGDRLRLFFDVQIVLREGRTPAPRFTVEGRLVVEGEVPPGAAPSGSWRIERLELIRGRTAPTGPGGRPPGQPPR